MISDREEAHATGAFNAPENLKSDPVVKKVIAKKPRGEQWTLRHSLPQKLPGRRYIVLNVPPH